VSVILGGGYLAYSIYETRFPQEQVQPDASKKTLVILGKPIPFTNLGGEGKVSVLIWRVQERGGEALRC
jgi:hypothetical protein